MRELVQVSTAQDLMDSPGGRGVAQALLAHNFDAGCLRPYSDRDGRAYITIMENGIPTAVPVSNASTTLRKDDWKLLDDAIVKAAKPRLRAVGDIRGRGLQLIIPNGLGKTVLETESQSDISAAIVSMDGLRESQRDRPTFDLTNLPLPIIHKDFSISARQLAASRNGGSPLDTTTAELAGRRVAEEAEKLLLGVSASYTYGGGTIYGLTNYPSSLSKVLTAPTVSGWTGNTLLTELLSMRTKSYDAYHYGPFAMYVAPDWDEYLDADYSSAKGDNTLRERIQKINGIESITTMDYMTDFDIVMVQMTSDVVRIVVGMEITTVQWEMVGGMQLNYKVMAIMVPQLRADSNGNTGIVHGAVV